MLRYQFLLRLLTPVLWSWLWLRGRKESAYRQRWSERLGLVKVKPAADVWIHGASLGELMAAKPLIDALLARDQQLLITAFTPAGSDFIRRQYGDSVAHCYLPIDWPGAVARFLKRAQPKRLLVLETEIWPNLLRQCQRQGLDICYASARLTDKSLASYLRLMPRRSFQKLLAPVRVIAAQTEADKKRFEALGALPQKVKVSGNIKFDLALPATYQAQRAEFKNLFSGRPVLLAASTHEGEESALLEVAKELRQSIPKLLLVIAPRHQARFDELAKQIAKQHALARRSLNQPCAADTEVYLADSLGELLALYGAADIAFVGGSLVPVGGHNVLEPALTETAAVVGPFLHEQPVAQSLVDLAAVHQVANAEGLRRLCQQLFSNPQLRQQRIAKASAFLAQNRGALKRTLELIA